MVTIDSDVFAYDDENDYSNESFVVSGSLDAATTYAVLAALSRAGARFMLVDETGVEHPHAEAAEAALRADLYTPNYVSDAEVTASGVEVYVDCKGSIEDPMAETFRRVLREELELVEVDVRVSALLAT